MLMSFVFLATEIVKWFAKAFLAALYLLNMRPVAVRVKSLTAKKLNNSSILTSRK